MSANLSWKEELQTKLQLQNSKEWSPLPYIFEKRAAGSFLLLKISAKWLVRLDKLGWECEEKSAPKPAWEVPTDPWSRTLWYNRQNVEGIFLFVCFRANSSYIFSSLTRWHHTEEP